MDDFIDIFLDGITFSEFVVFYSAGVSGITVRFLLNLNDGINNNPETPYIWSWRAFCKGAIRMFVSLVIMIFVVARFSEIAHYLIQIEDGAEYANVKITAGLAFILGIGIDEVVKRLVGGGTKIIKSKMK